MIQFCRPLFAGRSPSRARRAFVDNAVDGARKDAARNHLVWALVTAAPALTGR